METIETIIFCRKVTFTTMRTIIEYMQLCHIHFYQKIASKKVPRKCSLMHISHIEMSDDELLTCTVRKLTWKSLDINSSKMKCAFN